jgi:acetyl-CoA acetyltransferase
MMSMEGRRGQVDSGDLRLRARHPQSHQGVCADAIATMEGITRQHVDALGVESQKRAAKAIESGYFEKCLVPVYREDGGLALDREEYPGPQTTMESLAALKPAFPAVAGSPIDDKGSTSQVEKRIVYFRLWDRASSPKWHAICDTIRIDAASALCARSCKPVAHLARIYAELSGHRTSEPSLGA